MDQSEAVETGVGDGLGIEQQGGHGRDQVERGHPFLPDQFQNGPGPEVAQDDVGPADAGDAVSGAPPVGMEQRNGVQLHVGLAVLQSEDHAQGVQVEIAVGQHHSLGPGRGSTGVEELGNCILVPYGVGEGVRTARLDRLLVAEGVKPGEGGLAIQEDMALEVGRVLANFPDEGKELFFQQQQPRFGVVEDVTKIPGGETHVERQEDGAGLHHPVVGFQQAVTIAAEIGHHRSGLDSQRHQEVRQAVDSPAELAVAEAPGSADHRGLAGVELHRTAQEHQGSERDVHGASGGLWVSRAKSRAKPQ